MAKKVQHTPTERDHITEERIEQLYNELVVLPLSRENLRTAVVKVSEAFFGVGEVGTSNSGYWVDKFLAQCGLGPRQFWCMAFVQAMIRWACDVWKAADILPFNSAGTRAVWNYARKNLLVTTLLSEIRPGDVLIWALTGSTLGHTGLVVRVQWDGKKLIVTTIEGNVGAKLWRNGGSIEYRCYEYTQANYSRDVNGRYLLGAVSFDKMYDRHITKLPA